MSVCIAVCEFDGWDGTNVMCTRRDSHRRQVGGDRLEAQLPDVRGHLAVRAVHRRVRLHGGGALLGGALLGAHRPVRSRPEQSQDGRRAARRRAARERRPRARRLPRGVPSAPHFHRHFSQ